MDILRWEQEEGLSHEKSFHENLHLSRSEEDMAIIKSLSHPRLKSLEYLEKHIPESLTGRVLDAGAGNGYLTATLSKIVSVRQVFCLEITVAATERLIPRCVELAQADTSKITIVQGTYDNIPLTNFFDTVFCFGSLHHSANLLMSMKSLFASLVPGGFLVAHEPVTDDLTPNSAFIADMSRTRTEDGGQRHDHFFRRAEWLVAAHHANFNVLEFESVVPASGGGKKQGNWRLLKFLSGKSEQERSGRADAALKHDILKPVPHLIVLQKPEATPGVAPHIWA